MPDTSRTQAINENVAIEFAERERRDIRARELAANINELRERLRVLRPQRQELFEKETVAAAKAQEYYDKLVSELAVEDPIPVINANILQSNLGVAYKKELAKIRTHTINNTTTSDAFKHATKRRAKLRNRMAWKLKRANDDFIRLKKEAEHNYLKVLAEYEAITAQFDIVEETNKEIKDALALLVSEADALNTGQGKIRQRHPTHKRHKKGKNTRKRRL